MKKNNATQVAKPQSRAELRRAFAEFKRLQRYEKSGFIDFSSYAGVPVKQTKYMPHVGNKEKGIIVDNAA